MKTDHISRKDMNIMRRCISRIIITALALMLVSAGFAFAAVSEDAAGSNFTLGENGAAARDLFRIYDNNIIFAYDMDSLSESLRRAEDMAEETQQMFMVYLVPGDYKTDDAVRVPENVLLVGEKDTVITQTSLRPNYLIRVSGSVYGGTYVGNPKMPDKQGRVILFNDHEFKAPNGIVQNTNVSKAGWSGIEARGTSTKGCQVIGNTVKNCNGNGIRSIGGSTIALIEGNDVSGSGQAGIDITLANVNVIKGNNIHKVKGHGISTDTEQKFKSGQVGYGCKAKCVIKDVIDNTITDTGTHGIYLEDNCHIKGTMSGNKIGKNGKCALGTHPKTTVGNMEKNELYGSKMSVFGVSGNAVMGSGNIIRNGKATGIAISKGGKLTIKGSKNKIYKNKGNGITLTESCSLKITGKKNSIYSNSWGVILVGKKCKATIKNTSIYGNKKGAIYCNKGSSFTRKGGSVKGRVYKKK